jgi:hypothetical protein
MPYDELQVSGENTKFKVCRQCGRKGLYQIKQHFCRCRYCGTYIISREETADQAGASAPTLPAAI